MLERRNLIVFGCGRKGSGKSKLLHDRFVRASPRVISLDVTGETREQFPDAIECAGLSAVRRALRVAAEKGKRRWHLAAALEPDEVRELFGMLAPALGAGARSLSRDFGGIAVECGECDLIAPVSGASGDVLSAWRRGRHHLLSLFMATQRPATCARDLTAQADVIFALAQTEPRDVDFIARTISSPVADLVRALPLHHFVYYTRDDGRVYLCDDRRRVLRTLDTSGAPVTG